MPGADFLLLDPAQAPPRGRTTWLAGALRAAVADGRLQPGARLPASRVLAAELSMSRGTVVEAYRRLSEEGVLRTNRGGGTRITGLQPVRVSDAGATPTDDDAPSPLEISSGMPDLASFPRAAWVRAERAALATATARELGYTDPQGVPALRTALAGWLARSRGVVVDSQRIIVTGGATGALSLLGQELTAQGHRTCAVEDPGAAGNRDILEHWVARVTPVPVDDAGLRVDALAETDARAVVVTPAHQFPTGVVLSPERRRSLVAWADAVDGLVIEDDYDSEYRYDRTPVRALQATAPARVAHVSSLSKMLAPALRIGWLFAPPSLHDALVRRRRATDQGSPALPQLALAELIVGGTLERHLRLVGRRHRARRDAAVESIRRFLPGCPVYGVAAGLHLVVGLPSDLDDADVAARARGIGILVDPLSRHRLAPGPPGLVIGYGPHPPHRLARALDALGRVVASARTDH